MVGAARVLDQNFENEGKFHGYFCCKQHPLYLGDLYSGDVGRLILDDM